MSEVLVVCRQASDPYVAGSVKGFFCRTCGKELQVTPTGIRQIRDLGGAPYCNSCGFLQAQKHQAKGELGELVLSPQAQEKLKAQGLLDSIIAGKEVVELTPEEFFDIVKAREKMRRAAGN